MTVYAFGNGTALGEIFNALALVFSTGSYESLLRVGLLFLLVGILLLWAFQGRLLWPLMIGGFVLTFLAVTITTTVTIEDQVDPLAGPVVVANVPLFIAVPFAWGSEIEYRLSRLIETATSIPGVYRATNSKFNRFLFDMQKILDARLVYSDLYLNLKAFLWGCIFPEIDNNNVKAFDYLNSLDVLAQLGAFLNPARFSRLYEDGTEVGALSCDVMYPTVIQPGFTAPGPDYEESMRKLRVWLQTDPATPNLELDHVDDLKAMWSIAQNSRALINNVIIRYAWEQAERDNMARLGNTAGLMEMAIQSLGQQLKFQAYASGEVAQRLVPALRTMAEGLIVMLAPFLFVLAFTTGMGRGLGLWLRTFVWVHMWGPIYVVLNFILYLAAQNETTPLIATLGGVTISNLDELRTYTAMLNSIAANAQWGVPLVAWAVASGAGGLASAVLGSFGEVRHGAESTGRTFGQGHGSVYSDTPAVSKPSEVPELTSLGSTAHLYRRDLPVPGQEVMYQSGAREIRHADGGVTTIGPTGTVQYRGPYGSYTRSRDGRLLSGYEVRKRDLPDGGSRIAHMRAVGGDQVEISTVEQHPDGSIMTASSVASSSGHLIEQKRQYRNQNMTYTDTLYRDGSRRAEGIYYGGVDVQTEDGRIDYVQGTFRFLIPDFKPEGNNTIIGTLEGADGRFYHDVRGIARFNPETGIPEFQSLSGKIGNITQRESVVGRWNVQRLTSHDGRTQYRREGQGYFWFVDASGTERHVQGQVIDHGYINDKGEFVSKRAEFYGQDGELKGTGVFHDREQESDPYGGVTYKSNVFRAVRSDEQSGVHQLRTAWNGVEWTGVRMRDGFAFVEGKTQKFVTLRYGDGTEEQFGRTRLEFFGTPVFDRRGNVVGVENIVARIKGVDGSGYEDVNVIPVYDAGGDLAYYQVVSGKSSNVYEKTEVRPDGTKAATEIGAQGGGLETNEYRGPVALHDVNRRALTVPGSLHAESGLGEPVVFATMRVGDKDGKAYEGTGIAVRGDDGKWHFYENASIAKRVAQTETLTSEGMRKTTYAADGAETSRLHGAQSVQLRLGGKTIDIPAANVEFWALRDKNGNEIPGVVMVSAVHDGMLYNGYARVNDDGTLTAISGTGSNEFKVTKLESTAIGAQETTALMTPDEVVKTLKNYAGELRVYTSDGHDRIVSGTLSDVAVEPDGSVLAKVQAGDYTAEGYVYGEDASGRPIFVEQHGVWDDRSIRRFVDAHGIDTTITDGVVEGRGTVQNVPLYRDGRLMKVLSEAAVTLSGRVDPKTGEYEISSMRVTSTANADESYAVYPRDGGGFTVVAGGSDERVIARGGGHPWGLQVTETDPDNAPVSSHVLPGGVVQIGEVRDVETGEVVRGPMQVEVPKEYVGQPVKFYHASGPAQITVSEGGKTSSQMGYIDEYGLTFSDGRRIPVLNTFRSTRDGKINKVGRREAIDGQDVFVVTAGDEKQTLTRDVVLDGGDGVKHHVSAVVDPKTGEVVYRDQKSGSRVDVIDPETGIHWQIVGDSKLQKLLGTFHQVLPEARLFGPDNQSIMTLKNVDLYASGAVKDLGNGEFQLVPATIRMSVANDRLNVHGYVQMIEDPDRPGQKALRIVDVEAEQEFEAKIKDPRTGLAMEIFRAGDGKISYKVAHNSSMNAMVQYGDHTYPATLRVVSATGTIEGPIDLDHPERMIQNMSQIEASYRLNENGQTVTYTMSGRFERNDSGQLVFVPEKGVGDAIIEQFVAKDGMVDRQSMSQAGQVLLEILETGKSRREYDNAVIDRRVEVLTNAAGEILRMYEMGELDVRNLTDEQREFLTLAAQVDVASHTFHKIMRTAGPFGALLDKFRSFRQGRFSLPGGGSGPARPGPGPGRSMGGPGQRPAGPVNRERDPRSGNLLNTEMRMREALGNNSANEIN
ncbi:MAG: conjugal transfer protein TraG [Nitrospirae bacterium]|nr:MAG: conjugal transfer protein TraG [Nitrospirota bacterium]